MTSQLPFVPRVERAPGGFTPTPLSEKDIDEVVELIEELQALNPQHHFDLELLVPLEEELRSNLYAKVSFDAARTNCWFYVFALTRQSLLGSETVLVSRLYFSFNNSSVKHLLCQIVADGAGSAVALTMVDTTLKSLLAAEIGEDSSGKLWTITR